MSLCYFAASAPLAAQLSSASIEAAQRYSAERAGIGMIVKERGKIRFEKYYGGHSQKKPIHIYSGTKSFFGVLAVIAQDEGILSLDERVAETLPEWRQDPRKSQITVRELLDFTSGLKTGFEEIYGRSTADKLTLAVGIDAKADRGAAFIYGPSHLQVFCEVLRRKLKKRGLTYTEYLERKLVKPLGIDITQWRSDSHGNPIPSAGMWMTGRDWLSFGEMVCHGGEWGGKQLVRSGSLATCFRATPINPAFGLCFWVNSYCNQADAREVDVEVFLDKEPMPEDWSRACLSKSAPADLVCSLGSNFQRLYVVPSMDLVVVHQGKKGNQFRDAEFLKLLFADAEAPTPTLTDGGGSKERKVRPMLPKGKGLGGLFKRQEP
ncbi:MAG TPA: serine hydrolase [Bacteroidia bacterium]|nr:serine hydrolase [Bacteroidia bacterium]